MYLFNKYKQPVEFFISAKTGATFKGTIINDFLNPYPQIPDSKTFKIHFTASNNIIYVKT